MDPTLQRWFAKLFLTDAQVLKHDARPIKRFSIVGCRIMRIKWKKKYGVEMGSIQH